MLVTGLNAFAAKFPGDVEGLFAAIGNSGGAKSQ
jgi:hypothetical protein